MTNDTKNEPGGPKFMSNPDDVRPKPKRFYKQVSVETSDEGHAIHLDGRPIKTPMKQSLQVRSEPLARAIADEWDAQEDVIDHEAMLFTKLANTAIDRVGPRRQDIIDEIISYAGSDLLCYRASEPASLQVHEAENWDPFLQWLEGTYNVQLQTTSGIIHVSQEESQLQKLGQVLSSYDDLSLTVLHNLTTLIGSAILPLALIETDWQADHIWQVAHIDEDFQIERWGQDEEAQARRQKRRLEFDRTYEFYQLAVKDL